MAVKTAAEKTPDEIASEQTKRSRPHTPAQLIRAYCYDCMDNHAHDCLLPKCKLYPAHPFRGRLPKVDSGASA